MSSVLGRILRREGTSKLGLGDRSGVNKNAPPTFVPKIIQGGYTNVEDLEHLDFVARNDPVAKFIVFGVSEMIFDDWFVLVDANGDELANNTKMQREMRRLGAKKVFTQCLAALRRFGKAYLYTGKNRFISTTEGGKIASLHCFTPIECVIHEYYDETNAKADGKTPGDPKTMKLTRTVGKGNTTEGQELFLPAKDFIFWDITDSVLQAIWDMLVYIRYIFHSMAWFDMKIGAGLFVGYAEAGFGDEAKGKWNTTFADISVKRSIILDKAELSDLKFVGPTGSVTDFVAHIEMCIKTIAVATNLPYELLMGAAAGAVTGSETNIKLSDEFERRVKGGVEPYFIELFERMGWNDDPLFEWLVKTAQTEEAKANVEQVHAQAQATKTHLLIDEKREIDGYPPLPDGRGDILESETSDPLSEFSKAFGETPQEEPNNPQGDQA